MKIELLIGERLSLAHVLPAQDSFERLVLRESILDQVSLTSEEVDKYEVKTTVSDNAATATWNDAEVLFKYEFSSSELDYIKENLKTMSEQKKLDSSMVGMYRKFVT